MRVLLTAVLALCPAAAVAESFLIQGATVHPISRPEIQNGSILVRDGKIAGVGTNLSAPDGAKIIDARGMHVYPGMIDSATSLGMAEIGAVRETVDTNELGDFNPQLRAEVAINPASEHIPVTRSNGISTAISMPGGGIISGQSALMHLDGWTWEEMAVLPSAGMVMQFPAIVTASFRFPEGANRTPYVEAKRVYDTKIRELNEFFESARRYQKAKQAALPQFERDLKYEAMLPVLEGKLSVVIMAPRERQIKDAIAFADKQKIKLIIADPKEIGTAGPDLKLHNIPVILGPTLELPLHEDDPYDAAFTLPWQLYQAGVKFAFGTFKGSDNADPRNLPYQAATAVAYGLPYEEAVKAVTINAAQIWGVADRIGSIDEGKWADLIITTGDPLETSTQVKQMFVKGKPVDLDNKQKRLYEKYLNRP